MRGVVYICAARKQWDSLERGSIGYISLYIYIRARCGIYYIMRDEFCVFISVVVALCAIREGRGICHVSEMYCYNCCIELELYVIIYCIFIFSSIFCNKNIYCYIQRGYFQ